MASPLKDDQDDFELINPNDFKSIRLELSVMNVTTKTQVSKGKRIYGDQDVTAEGENLQLDFIEFTDDGFVIEVPIKSGAVGHILMVGVETEGATPKIQIIVSAKILEVERMEGPRDRFILQLTEYDREAWGSLNALFSKRQAEIEEFFLAVKG